jgi:PAS domain-containing protein
VRADHAHLTHPDDRDRHDALRVELLTGLRESFSVEKRYLRKDGSAIWVKRTVTRARDAANEAPYLIQVIEDISGLKQAEAQLSDHQRRFESMFEQAAVGITRVDLNGMLVEPIRSFVTCSV